MVQTTKIKGIEERYSIFLFQLTPKKQKRNEVTPSQRDQQGHQQLDYGVNIVCLGRSMSEGMRNC